MTLPSSGYISLGQVLAELRTVNPGRSSYITLNDTDVRVLAGVPAGGYTMSSLYGKSAYIPMNVVGNNDSTDVGTSGVGGTATCFPSVSVSGGSGGYTFQWTVTAQSGGCTFGNANSQNFSVSHTYGRFSSGNANAQMSCTVTDNTGHQVTVSNIFGYLSWNNGN